MHLASQGTEWAEQVCNQEVADSPPESHTPLVPTSTPVSMQSVPAPKWIEEKHQKNKRISSILPGRNTRMPVEDSLGCRVNIISSCNSSLCTNLNMCSNSLKRNGESREMTLWMMLPPEWNMVSLHLQVSLISHVIPKQTSGELERGNYRIWVYLSCTQHTSPDIMFKAKVTKF